MFLNTFQSLDHLVHSTSQKHARAQWLQKYFCKNSTIRKLLYRQHLISTQAKFSHIVYQMVQNYQSVKNRSLYVRMVFSLFANTHGIKINFKKEKAGYKILELCVCLSWGYFLWVHCLHICAFDALVLNIVGVVRFLLFFHSCFWWFFFFIFDIVYFFSFCCCEHILVLYFTQRVHLDQ